MRNRRPFPFWFFNARLATAIGIGGLCLLFLSLGSVRPVSAWDSALGSSSSHYRLLEDVLDLVPLPPADVVYENTYHNDMLAGSVNEAAHGQIRSNPYNCNYALKAVGNNSGTTHPEYWWQDALCYYRAGDHATAYFQLGKLIHLIQDQTSVPHSYNDMHGGSFGMDNFEILSADKSMDYTYYISPGDSDLHPGKNILNEDSHYDGADANWDLNYNVYAWTLVTSTIMQVPTPLGIQVDTSIVGCGSPDYVYLKAVYDRLDGTTGEQVFGPFSPRCTSWIRWTLNPDNFAPNGSLTFYYQRNEDCCTSWTGQLQVYVTTVNDALAAGEFQRPAFRHPWEYYDFLRQWSLWATRAPYFRAYSSMSQYYTPLDFSIIWDTAPNTERALLTLQWDVTSHVLQWFLEDAYAAFADPAYTLESATGSGYRVVLYDLTGYNSGSTTSPEYLFSHSISCEPYAGSPCGAFIPPVAPTSLQVPIFDDDYVASGSGSQVTLSSGTLGFMDTRVSSLEIRGAKVTLFADSYHVGQRVTFLADTPELGGYEDWARSIKIEPPTVLYLAGLIWLDLDQNGQQSLDEPPLPGVQLYLLYDANEDGNLVIPPGGVSQTDPKGNYQFSDLFAGDYVLAVDVGSLPPGYFPTYDPDGLTTPYQTALQLLAGTALSDQNFGFGVTETKTFLPILVR